MDSNMAKELVNAVRSMNNTLSTIAVALASIDKQLDKGLSVEGSFDLMADEDITAVKLKK